MIEKREIERFDISLQVKLIADTNVIEGLYTENISSHGMFVGTNIPLDLNSQVEVSVFLPVCENERKSHIRAKGRVVRINKRGMAIVFERIGNISRSPTRSTH